MAMCVPMAAVALAPVTALAGVIASALALWIGTVVGAVFLISVVLVVAYLIATVLFDYGSRPHDSGWRRFLPHAVSAGVLTAGLTEIISGSRAPDPVIALWFIALAWLVVFGAHVDARWSVARYVLWLSGPLVTVAMIIVIATSGFFALRFDRSVADLDAYVARLEAGERFVPHTEVGWFTLESRRLLPGCADAFVITGWHENDDRSIAYCPAGPPPNSDADHLSGSWYEYQE